MPRDRREIVVIWWRDIPTQVNAQSGRERYQLLLPDRFQRAVDRAKRKAKIYTAHEDIAQWRRVSEPLVGEPEEAAAAVVARLDDEYPRERLGLLAFAGGFEADVQSIEVSRAELAALEELEEDE